MTDPWITIVYALWLLAFDILGVGVLVWGTYQILKMWQRDRRR